MRLFDRIAGHGFNFASKTSGARTISIVHPISDWHLPPGYVYSQRDDAILDGSGIPVSLSECATFWQTSPIDIISVPPQFAESLLPAGEVTTGSMGVYVRDTEKLPLLSSSFGLLVDEASGVHSVYRISNIQPFPPDNPATLLVTAFRYGVV